MKSYLILKTKGSIEQKTIKIKNNEKFSIEKFNKLIDKNLNKLYEWEVDNKNILLLLGDDQNNKIEINTHALPIEDTYQYYNDLYILLVNNNKLTNIDTDTFENIYHALLLNMSDNENDEDIISDDEDNDDDDDEISDDLDIQDLDDLEEIEDYCDELSEDEDIIEDDNNEKIPKKNINLIKINNNNDILYKESEIKKLNNTIRIKILELLYKLFDTIDDKLDIYLKELEKEIYNYTIDKCISKNIVPTWNIILKKVYINKSRSLYTNLQNNNYIKNNRLKDRLLNYEFTAKELVNMTPQELFPENWKKLIDEKYKREKVLYETKKEAMTDQFKCKKCKKRETAYYELQTRSADEPMTIFITCINCGNRWKN